MGREVRRVPLDFDWPLQKVWIGFVWPWGNYSTECASCNGSGYSPRARQLEASWYGDERWCENIDQADVDALVADGRLTAFTHRRVGGKLEPTGNTPTAEEVNECVRNGSGLTRIMVHDAINRYICIREKCQREGVDSKCSKCGGSGALWPSKEIKAAADAWEPIDPPTGDGWQVWENVSEGSPVTKVYPTAEAMIDALVSGADGEPISRTAAENFVRDLGWCPSMVISGGILYEGIESAALLQPGADKEAESHE